MGLQIALHSFVPGDGVGKEGYRLLEAFVRLGATEADEPLAGRAEALAP
jgi:hypothetical protein